MKIQYTDAEKAVFKAATDRRKANGIKLAQFRVYLDSNQAESANDFWNGWVEELGKQNAGDYLLIAMRKADEALRRAIANTHLRKQDAAIRRAIAPTTAQEGPGSDEGEEV